MLNASICTSEKKEDDMMIQIKKSNRDCTRHTCLASSQSLKIR